MDHRLWTSLAFLLLAIAVPLGWQHHNTAATAVCILALGAGATGGVKSKQHRPVNNDEEA